MHRVDVVEHRAQSGTRIHHDGWTRATPRKVSNADQGRYAQAIQTPPRIGGDSRLVHDLAYFIAIPWGRAGPVGKAVLKSSLKRVSSVSVSLVTLTTCTLWSPSKWMIPASSSFRK